MLYHVSLVLYDSVIGTNSVSIQLTTYKFELHGGILSRLHYCYGSGGTNSIVEFSVFPIVGR